jgi:hypothetical protein
MLVVNQVLIELEAKYAYFVIYIVQLLSLLFTHYLVTLETVASLKSWSGIWMCWKHGDCKMAVKTFDSFQKLGFFWLHVCLAILQSLVENIWQQFLFVFSFPGSNGVWSQGLTLVRHMCYHFNPGEHFLILQLNGSFTFEKSELLC